MSEVKKTIYGLNASDYPRRMGVSWKDDEVSQLLNEVGNKLSVQDISLIHERTPGGIYAQLNKVVAYYYFNNNSPIEEIMKITGLSEKQIYTAIDRQKLKNFTAEKKKMMLDEKLSNKPPKTKILLATIMEEIENIKKRLTALEKTKVYVVKFKHDPT